MKSQQASQHALAVTRSVALIALLTSAYASSPNILLQQTSGSSSTAQDNSDRVIIHVGAPSVWSMAQAHYLLTKMHRDNRLLTTKMPDQQALDPNAINITRIQVIKSLLDLQAQFDQKLGVENRAKLSEYERKLSERERARTELIAVTAQLQALDTELALLKKDLARKNVELNQKKNAQQQTGNGQSDEINRLERDIAVLENEIEVKDSQRKELVARKAPLETSADKDVDVSGLANIDFGNHSTSLPSFSALSEYLTEAVGKVDIPRLAATLALDNFIGMQYEIISKQLTLLRDEVGRDSRIVFLELPASIYTVAGKGDDYIAQVRWKVERYAESKEGIEKELYDGETDNNEKSQQANSQEERNNQNSQQQSAEGQTKQKTLSIIEQIRISKQGLKPIPKGNDEQKKQYEESIKQEKKECEDVGGDWKETLCWKKPDSSYIRALDIIPHQSNLIVNDVQATTRHKNFLGGLKLLSGFGLKINYQHQKELYEQFLQQETFAAGFGKGMTEFGWTFGPQPGTKRVAPGVRTMYAVLVVPERTKAIELKAEGIAYHRKKAPDYISRQQLVANPNLFTVIVPNAEIANWYASQVYYTSVTAGEPVTVIIRGQGFSAQTSVLVDGAALKSIHSIGNSASSDAIEDNAAGGVRGQFEIVNSQLVIMKFAMGDRSYTGIPTITIVAPERSAAINFFWMDRINGRNNARLIDFSLLEPMFIESFRLDRKLYDVHPEANMEFVTASLKGAGLRRNADIWVGGVQVESAKQLDSREYRLRLLRPKTNIWPVRFRQPTVRGFEVEEFDHINSKAGRVEIFSYAPNSSSRQATLELRFWGNQKPDEAVLLPYGSGSRNGEFILESNQPGSEVFRATFTVNYESHSELSIERDKVSVRVRIGENIRTTVLDIPVRPQVDSISISAPPIPDERGSVITIKGINMQNVVKVFIADQEAQITALPTNDSITVRLSRGTFIREERGLKIPVTLVTKEGSSVTAVVAIN